MTGSGSEVGDRTGRAVVERDRVLGVDFGTRRIGLALSDPTRTLASPLDTVVRRRGKRMPLARIAERVHHIGVAAIVVGLPLDFEGRENAWCAEIRAAGDELGRRLAVPVHYVDERFTSVQAEAGLRAQGVRPSRRGEKARVDAAAAAVILQSFLDHSERS